MKKWEKIFVISSIVIILIIIGIYAYRTIYYYNLTHSKPSDNKLVNYIFKNERIVYKDSGLYQDVNDENVYIYKGLNVNNYVYYSGIIWRIVSINENDFKLISDTNLTLLAWNKKNYEESSVKDWLTNSKGFVSMLMDSSDYLVDSSWCVDSISLDNITCNNKITSNIGLLSVKEYLDALGKDSYLNNNSYWWTMNTSENKVWYVFSDGGINDNSNTDEIYYSYGIRPVITINKDISLYSGTGTKDDPYIIQNTSNVVLNQNSIGSYIEYSNYTWRIQNIADDYVKLVLDGELENKLNYTETIKYIEKEFSNINSLVQCPFYNDSYNLVNNYTLNKTINNTIGLSSVGDLFISDYTGQWLNTTLDNNLTYIVSNSSIFADSITNYNSIRPSICIKPDLIIKNGSGLKNDPLIVEE